MTEPAEIDRAIAAKPRIGNSAAGQVLGVSVQYSRAVAHLLRAHPGEAVCFEHLDDVATVGSDRQVVEQDKSGLAHNPVSDRAPDLWKTLDAWSSALTSGSATAATAFVLYVAQSHSGDVVGRIAAVNDQADGEILARSLRKEMSLVVESAAEPAQSGKHIRSVLARTDELLGRLFVRVTIETGTGALDADLLALLGEKLISEPARQSVLESAIGWVKVQIDRALERSLVPVLKVDDFNRALLAAAKKFDRAATVLFAAPILIQRGQIEDELRARTYVRQMKAIECDEPDLEDAVADYLRAAADRVRWVETGEVLENSFDEFQDDLQRAWSTHRQLTDLENPASPDADRGRILRLRCSRERIALQGMEVPSHFVPGSLHRLSDALRIGWHPLWRQLFDLLEAADDSDCRGDRH